MLAGAVPQRDPAHQTLGRMPAPGWLPANRWQGVKSVAADTADLAPTHGVVASNGVQSPSQPGLGFDGGDRYRLDRLRYLINSREVHSRDSFIAAQNDIVSPAARALLPLNRKSVV